VSAVLGAIISVLNLALKWGQSIRMGEVLYSTKWVNSSTAKSVLAGEKLIATYSIST
jgi:hypothetical protein